MRGFGALCESCTEIGFVLGHCFAALEPCKSDNWDDASNNRDRALIFGLRDGIASLNGGHAKIYK
jgi:hypothetical protein